MGLSFGQPLEVTIFHSLFLGKPSQAVKNRFADASDDKNNLAPTPVPRPASPSVL